MALALQALNLLFVLLELRGDSLDSLDPFLA